MKHFTLLVCGVMFFITRPIVGQKHSDLEKKVWNLVQAQRHTAEKTAAAKCTKDSVYSQYWSSFSNGWVNLKKTLLYYDSQNKLAYQTEWAWFSTTWQFSAKMSNSYNSAGNLISSLRQNVGWDQTLTNQSLRTCTYSASQKILADLNQNWQNDQWQNSTLISYGYDGAQNNTLYIEQTWDQINNQWNNESKSTYTFNTTTK